MRDSDQILSCHSSPSPFAVSISFKCARAHGASALVHTQKW